MLATLYPFFVLLAEAQQDAGDQQGQGGPPSWLTFAPIILIAVVFFFMMSRSARRQERDRQTMVSSLDKGDKVLTAAGIYGTIISVSENEDEVIIKVDDNTRLHMVKASITRNISKEEARAAQKKS